MSRQRKLNYDAKLVTTGGYMCFYDFQRLAFFGFKDQKATGLAQDFYVLRMAASSSTFPVVFNGNAAAVQFNYRIAPRHVSAGSFAFGMLDSPSDHLPPSLGFQDLPFGPVGPILLLHQHPLRRRDLVAVAPLLGSSGCSIRVVLSPHPESNEKNSAIIQYLSIPVISA
jgi:hypothetical protein